MDRLKAVVKQTMEGYAGKAFNGYSYLTHSADESFLAVISVGKVKDKRIVNTGLVVSLLDNMVVIEQDINDKPLVDALVQAGISRKQIILAYTGEKEDLLVE